MKTMQQVLAQDAFTAFLTRPRNRFDDALEIQLGAGNIIAIGATLITAARECQDERHDWRGDPALQMIVHQLCHLVGVQTVDYPRNSYGGFNYAEADAACCRKASFPTLLYLAEAAERSRASALRELRVVGLAGALEAA
jgi:hypothetical protein